tara:strand:- start:238 stop:432 length:195 start_codon:yes stop_codon:yes gene_type:complete
LGIAKVMDGKNMVAKALIWDMLVKALDLGMLKASCLDMLTMQKVEVTGCNYINPSLAILQVADS